MNAPDQSLGGSGSSDSVLFGIDQTPQPAEK